jgi:hypothetical protein
MDHHDDRSKAGAALKKVYKPFLKAVMPIIPFFQFNVTHVFPDLAVSHFEAPPSINMTIWSRIWLTKST